MLRRRGDLATAYDEIEFVAEASLLPNVPEENAPGETGVLQSAGQQTADRLIVNLEGCDAQGQDQHNDDWALDSDVL